MEFDHGGNKEHILNYKRLISLVVAAGLLCSCSSKPQETEETTAATTEETTIITEITTEETAGTMFPPIEYSVSYPEIEKAEGITKEVYFSRDGEWICGRITCPSGKGPFKTIIISHGLYASLGRYSDKAQRYCEYGYAVIEFEYLNCNPPDPYEDPEYLGDYIYEEVKDLFAVMDSLEYLPEVDRSNVYLYGHSMGGLVASYVGAMRPDDIKGLILVDPSFYAVDLMEFEKQQMITTDIYPLLKTLTVPVVIFTGTEGSFGEDPHFFDDARKALPGCKYIVIEGANHGFGGESGDHLVDLSVEVIRSWE